MALSKAIALDEAGEAERAQVVLGRFAQTSHLGWALCEVEIGSGGALSTALRRNSPPCSPPAPDDVVARAPINGTNGISTPARTRPADRPPYRRRRARGNPDFARRPSSPFGVADPAIGKARHPDQGVLFARMNPELARPEQAPNAAMAAHPGKPAFARCPHPPLSRRDQPWRISGCWSIRLDGEGHHAAHSHPRGMLSSASYWLVPD